MSDSIDPGRLPGEYGDDGANSGPGGPIRDTRPEYNPAVLVSQVMSLLDKAGIHTYAGASANVAALAAADLLRALGVRPAAAPRHPTR